jgi:multisubunit Na+/H+ antiporter MnhB subunit
MSEQSIGLVTAGVLAISGIVLLAMATERRRRRRLRRRLRVSGTMLFVSGLLIFGASLVLLPPEDLTSSEMPLPADWGDLWPNY